MRTLEPVLAEHLFFAGLDPRCLKVIAGCASNMVFQPGKYLCRIGEPADHFYIIREGNVALEILRGAANPINIQTIGHGEVLGWSWLIPPHQWRFDGRAIERTRVVALDGKCLRGKCERDHDLGYALLKRFSGILTERLEATRLQLLDVYGIPAE